MTKTKTNKTKKYNNKTKQLFPEELYSQINLFDSPPIVPVNTPLLVSANMDKQWHAQ